MASKPFQEDKFQEVRLRTHFIRNERSLGMKNMIKVKLDMGLGVFRHSELTITKNGDKKRIGSFVASEKTLTKKVRMPKNKTSLKIHKKEIAVAKNHSDGILAERALLNPIYEKYCNKYGFIEWKKFEKYFNGKTFQKRIKTLDA